MSERFQVGDRVQVYNPGPKSVGTVIADELEGDVDPRVAVHFDDQLEGEYSRSLVRLLRKVES